MGFFDNIMQSAKNTAKEVSSDMINGGLNSSTKKVEVGAVPANIDEFKAKVDFKDSSNVVAFTILALCVYPHNKDFSIEMLNYLKGPGELSTYDKQFLSDRLVGKDYLMMSYLNGTSPENNYTPTEPYTVDVTKTPHSEDAIGEGYLQLFVKSSGADAQRGIRLRNKPSTGEWFLWEYFVLAGIREPKANDPWA